VSFGNARRDHRGLHLEVVQKLNAAADGIQDIVMSAAGKIDELGDQGLRPGPLAVGFC